VLSPGVVGEEWNVIGMSFLDQLDFADFSEGSIDLFGNAIFNNVSFYLADGLGVKTDINIRTWENVLNYEGSTRLWSFWDAGSQTWRDVYVLGQTTSLFSTPADIYKTYTGTNVSIVDDGMGMRFNKTSSSVYTQVLWHSLTEKPA
jgi:hypothetical protein